MGVGLALGGGQRRTRTTGDDWPRKVQIVADQCHPKQRELVDNEGLRLAAIVGRRGGKTTAVRVRFFRRLLTTPRARCLYIAATRSSAEELMWGPLKDIFERSGFTIGGDVSFNETKLKLVVHGNKSQLQLVGADNMRDIEKLRGQYFHEVWIDESGSYPPSLLRNLIERIIAPTLGDYGGTLGLIGTPSHVLAGPFYEVTRPDSEIGQPFGQVEDPNGWVTHFWTLEDGAAAGIPAMANAWQAALAEKARNGWSDDHPVWKREWLGLWAADNTENVFKYRPHLDGKPWNQWDPPKDPRTGFAVLPPGEWTYVYGMDLGASDLFALEVFAFNPHDAVLYHVREFGAPKMYAKSIAELLLGRELNHEEMGGLFAATDWPAAIVADTAGLGGAFLAELAEVYGIPIDPAEKKNKHDSIELFNGDLIDGRIVVLKDSKLEDQLIHLQWAVDDYGGLKENRSMRNDFADAAIYARRAAQHLFASTRPEDPVDPGTAEAADAWAQESLRKALRPPKEQFGDFQDFTDDDY